MNTRLRLLGSLCLLFCLGTFVPLTAQTAKDIVVSADYQATPLAEIFQDLQERYPVQFYLAAELPADGIDLDIRAMNLPELIEDLLRGTGLVARPYREYAYMILPRAAISNDYSNRFYAALEGRLIQGTENTTVVTIGADDEVRKGRKAKIVGRVLDGDTDDPIIGATVYWMELEQGVVSDVQGLWEAQIPPGLYRLQIQYLGYGLFDRLIEVKGNGVLDIKLRQQATNLATVVVEAENNDDNITNSQIGVTYLAVKKIEELPALLGEADVVRSLLTGPGVNSIGEGSVGFNVRGGAVDQNLILQGESVLFNSSHALGFFSTINPAVIRGVSLYKSILPAEYGGRLSSVLAVDMREGNTERFNMKGGVGFVTGKLAVEGPILGGAGSYLAAGRTSYTGWLLGTANNLEVSRSNMDFYDANVILSGRLSEDDKLRLSLYSAGDKFIYNQEFGFEYGTVSAELGYERRFSDELRSDFSVGVNRYSSEQTNFVGDETGTLNIGLNTLKIKEKLRWSREEDFVATGGVEMIMYQLPGQNQQPDDVSSLLPSLQLETERGREGAAFFQAEWSPNSVLAISAGLRFNLYQYLGGRTLLDYSPSTIESGIYHLNQATDTLEYNKGEVIQTYTSLEPRISARLQVTPSTSFKLGYSRTSQFINQIFNTATPTPQSQFQLSTPYIKPFLAHNFSAGYFQNYFNNRMQTSIEGFYRPVDQLWDYRDFAVLVGNSHLETELLPGEGRAYGVEGSIKANAELFDVQLNYTYSRTERRIAGINRGEWYPSNFDQPHNLNGVLSINIDDRQTLTANFTYATGRPTTAPVINYRVSGGLLVPIFSDRNQLRIPDYHRLDLSYTIVTGKDKERGLKTSWNFTIYNVYARKNAFSVFYTSRPDQRFVANRLSVLGTLFPSITFNFEWL